MTLNELIEETPSYKPAEIRYKSAAEILKTDYPPVKWIIPSMMPEGLTLLSGAPKIGKSWFALSLCVAVATGSSILSQKTEPRSVLYLCLEDSERRIQDRLKQLEAEGLDVSKLYVHTVCPRLNEGGIEQLVEAIDHYELSLIIIDTLQHVKPMARSGKDTYASDYDGLKPLQKLAQDKRIGIVLIHHTRKQESSDPFDKTSGTQALMGCADTSWVMARGRGEADGKLHITGRDVDEQELALAFDKASCQWKLLGEAHLIAASQEEQDVIELLEESGPNTNHFSWLCAEKRLVG
jgi:RecA-family ATPase